MSAIPSVNVAPNAGDNTSSLIPSGSMINFAGATAPAGWLLCDGSAISRIVYATLFSVIGTAYGSGDGSTTFNLPNTAGKVIRGVNGTYTRGGTGGADSVMLATNNLAPHSHTLWRPGNQAATGSGDWIGSPNVDTGAATGGNIYQATNTPTSGSRTQVVGQDGTGQVATNIVNTWVGVSYIIKV